MRASRHHLERHRSQHTGWLRAAVLGANDGVVSAASLLIGVAAAGATPRSIVLTGVAGLVAGAMSMAAGEYVSVYSQADTEQADLARERAELQADPAGEQHELAGLFTARGLPPALAVQVASTLSAHDALAAHAREELGLSPGGGAQPIQAAMSSAASFAVGAGLPLAVAAGAPTGTLIPWVATMSLLLLALLGAVAARAGGAGIALGAWRVAFWGALAMAITAGVGSLFGAVV